MDIWKTMQSDGGIKELEQQFMDLDTTFKFKCRQCGKCCKNQNPILFSPWDIFKIAKKIGKSPLRASKQKPQINCVYGWTN